MHEHQIKHEYEKVVHSFWETHCNLPASTPLDLLPQSSLGGFLPYVVRISVFVYKDHPAKIDQAFAFNDMAMKNWLPD